MMKMMYEILEFLAWFCDGIHRQFGGRCLESVWTSGTQPQMHRSDFVPCVYPERRLIFI